MVAVSGVDRDRSGLFAAVADFCPVDRALYPGSYVDLSPSTAFRSVTYVDTDARAARFFADTDLVRAQLAGRTRPGAGQEVRFLPGDYTQPLAVPETPTTLNLILPLPSSFSLSSKVSPGSCLHPVATATNTINA